MAVLAGALLLAGHFSGVSQWRGLLAFLREHLPAIPALDLLFLAVLLVASLGGVVVIAGGVAILQERVLLGKVLVVLGTGAGLVSFLLFLGPALLEGNLFHLGTSLVVAVGVGLSIVARLLVRR